MKRHKLTPEERETIIRTSDAEACWVVYSDSPAMIRQLRVLVTRVVGTDEPTQTSTGYRCVLPKAAVNALAARRKYGPLTKEERQARVARLYGQTASNAGRVDEEMTTAQQSSSGEEVMRSSKTEDLVLVASWIAHSPLLPYGLGAS